MTRDPTLSLPWPACVVYAPGRGLFFSWAEGWTRDPLRASRFPHLAAARRVVDAMPPGYQEGVTVTDWRGP